MTYAARSSGGLRSSTPRRRWFSGDSHPFYLVQSTSRRLHARVLAARGIPEDKPRVIEKWTDGDLIKPKPTRASALRVRLGLIDRFVVCYSGSLGRAHEFETL